MNKSERHVKKALSSKASDLQERMKKRRFVPEEMEDVFGTWTRAQAVGCSCDRGNPPCAACMDGFGVPWEEMLEGFGYTGENKESVPEEVPEETSKRSIMDITRRMF